MSFSPTRLLQNETKSRFADVARHEWTFSCAMLIYPQGCTIGSELLSSHFLQPDFLKTQRNHDWLLLLPMNGRFCARWSYPQGCTIDSDLLSSNFLEPDFFKTNSGSLSCSGINLPFLFFIPRLKSPTPPNTHVVFWELRHEN